MINRSSLKDKSFLNFLNKIKKADVKLLQFRVKKQDKSSILKDVSILKKELSQAQRLLIINDYIDVAKISDLDGVHLGQGDLAVSIARKVLGQNKIIGKSCHSFKEAEVAKNEGVDYISFGPVFHTKLKPALKPRGLKTLKKIINKINLPIFAIGGINLKNIGGLKRIGVKRIALCGAVMDSKNPADEIKKINFELR